MRVAAAELPQGRLSQNDCAGSFDLVDDEGVSIRIVVLEQHGAQGCRHSFGIELVFDDNGDSVQRTDKAGSLECGVEPVRLFEGFGVDRDDSVDRGSLLIVRFNTIEVRLYQPSGGEPAGFISAVNIIDGGFENVKGGY